MNIFYNFKDTYTGAVENMNIANIEELSDPSDADKLKSSRKKRHNKNDTEQSNTKAKKKKTVPIETSDEDSDDDSDTVSSNKVSKTTLNPPPALILTEKSNIKEADLCKAYATL